MGKSSNYAHFYLPEELFSSENNNNNIEDSSKLKRKLLDHFRETPLKTFIFYWKNGRFNGTRITMLKRLLLLILFGVAAYLIYDKYVDMNVAGWEEFRNRNLTFYILPDEHTALLEPRVVCKQTDPLLLLIFVFSAPGNFQARKAVRETWGNATNFNYAKFAHIHSQLKGRYLPFNFPDWRRFAENTEQTENMDYRFDDKDIEVDQSNANFRVRSVFIIGQTDDAEVQDKLADESLFHGDIVQEQFMESYQNLTLKAVMMMKWVNDNCIGKVKFVMKCDDDTFVNVPNLLHYLLGGTIPIYNATLNFIEDMIGDNERTLESVNRLNDYKNLLVGFELTHPEVVHGNKSNKGYTPHYMYDGDYYPSFLAGGPGYVFTMDTAAKLYKSAMVIPYLHLEDVYLTGLCAERSHIEPKNFRLFHFGAYKDICEFRGVITKHKVEPETHRLAYNLVINANDLCEAPTDMQLFKFKYNE